MGKGRAWLGMIRAAAVVAVAAVMGLVVAASSTADVTATSTAVEVAALVAIKAALRDPNNALGDWVANSGGSPCGWKSITCSDGFVEGLELRNLNLSGTLSPAIRKLRRLRNVVFDNNAISGPIPRSMVKLPLLQRLDLSHNRLNGTIPGTLGDLSGLLVLKLDNNNLSGSIPDSLATSRSLFILDLSYNNLSGTVPVFTVRNVFLTGNPLLCYIGCGTRYSSMLAEEALAPPIEKPLNRPISFEISHRMVILYLVTGFTVAFLFAGVIVVCSRRRRRQIFDDIDDEGVSEVRFGPVKRYMLKEIQEATGHFNRNNILGHGGYGIVFKGILDDKIVAVKRLKGFVSTSGEDQFKTEVEVISLVVHRHLLSLIGFCSQENERILVYPYMPNGTVSSKLQEYVYGRPALDWPRRKKIAIGTARGLVYLHEQCTPKIIHRDIKASNILLDEHFEAVVADFGLARLLDHGQSHIFSAVRGTFGRIPPEYLMMGESSEKTDVFGFGYLLIELITGRKTFDLHEDEYPDGGITDWAKELIETDQLGIIVDKKLGNNYDSGELQEMAQIALLCTTFSPVHRPSISQVLSMLEGDGTVAQRWEALKSVPTPVFGTPLGAMTSADHGGEDDYISVELEAVELSGPR